MPARYRRRSRAAQTRGAWRRDRHADCRAAALPRIMERGNVTRTMAAHHKSLFTSESVTEGHPDKVADSISDAVLDAILAQDPYGRVACETLVLTGQVHVAGEITTSCYIDIPRIARKTIRDIGYAESQVRFRRRHVRVVDFDRRAVCGHRPGRGQSAGSERWSGIWQVGRRVYRRRRPRHDVRLCVHRDGGADALADRARASADQAAGGGPQNKARSIFSAPMARRK